MKKSAITLESLNTTIESLDKKFDQNDQRFDKFGQILEHIQGSIEVLVKKIKENTLAIDDNTSSIQHLIEGALMRDELQPILNHEIIQSESRMISHMEGFIRRHITMEEEVLIHSDKIRVIERVLSLPNIA